MSDSRDKQDDSQRAPNQGNRRDREAEEARRESANVDAADEAAAPVMVEAPPRQSFKRRHWGKLLLLALVGVPVMGLTIYTASALNISYSDGKRVGFMQKISRKGWICKTWEGTLYLGTASSFRADSFQFSVRNDSVAHKIESLSGKRVSIDYSQHKGVPTSCFGESEYFVTGVSEIPG